MKLSSILKWLMIALPTTIISSCSSNKNISNDQISEDIVGVSTKTPHVNDNANILTEKQTSTQMQKNNIIYFDLDKYNIRSEFTAMLDAYVNFLRSNPFYKITVEGHTDERGTPEYNISLGERRANAIKMYLQSKGISEDRISIISYGKEKPAVLGHEEAVYAKNRRAILVY